MESSWRATPAFVVSRCAAAPSRRAWAECLYWGQSRRFTPIASASAQGLGSDLLIRSSNGRQRRRARRVSAGRSRLLLSALLQHGRQVPALIAVFEPAGTAVALQRATKVVRPGRQSKFAREIVKEFVGAGAFGVRSHGVQSGIAQRHALHWLTTSRCARRVGRRRRSRCTSSPSLLGRSRFPTETLQSTLGDFQLI